MSKFIIIFQLSICLCYTANVRAETVLVSPPDPNIPETLLAWKDRAYAKRYFLRVDAPGEGGAVGLQGDPPAASVLLPLKMTLPVSISGIKTSEITPEPAQPEDVLLVGEDNVVYPVLARQVTGGSEVEIAFATRPGLRKFCLYTNASAGVQKPTTVSPTTFRAQALRVKIRARTLTPELAYREDSPLTLKRFNAINEINDWTLGEKQQNNIDNPECPWFVIGVDAMGALNRKDNPPRYAAVYEAFLRTPVAGTYKFAIDTPGVVQLLINGKSVLSATKPNPSRAAFELSGSVELSEGVQRIVLYYAEAVLPISQTAADLSRFGLRLHWQPPFAKELLCIPAQAFPRALPAMLVSSDVLDTGTQPFIHIESLGHVRTGSQHGEALAQEQVLFSARGYGAPQGAKLSIEGLEGNANSQRLNKNNSDVARCFAWLPISQAVTFVLRADDGKELTRRKVTWPNRASGVRDVMELEAQLLLKAAPAFLYPEEMAHFHLETLLCPDPRIIPKERRENKLLPPPARPIGEFVVTGNLTPSKNDTLSLSLEQKADGMGLASRDKQRLSLPGDVLEKYSLDGAGQLKISLYVGGVQAEEITLRLLHSGAKQWSCAANGMKQIEAGAGSLLFAPASAMASGMKIGVQNSTSLLSQIKESLPDREKVLIVVPRENEAEYRRFAALKKASETLKDAQALFIGDPLVESSEGPSGHSGLPEQIAAAYPKLQWQHILLPGPHRQLPIFRLIAELEDFLRNKSDQKVPSTVVISLGNGDAARQTPLHNFERGLDVLIDRLRIAGAQRIIMIGVIPEPSREKQAEFYQERVLELLRQHHIEGVDVFNVWTREKNWAKRFSVEEGSDACYGPTPNKAALAEIVKLLKEKL